MTTPDARKHLSLLEHAVRGVQLSVAERDALARIARLLESPDVIALARVLNRARASVPPLAAP